MTKKRWTVEDKTKIVIESLTTSASTVDMCRKYGLSPNIFYPWRDKFRDGEGGLGRWLQYPDHQGNPEGECHSKDAGR